MPTPSTVIHHPRYGATLNRPTENPVCQNHITDFNISKISKQINQSLISQGFGPNILSQPLCLIRQNPLSTREKGLMATRKRSFR
jgi:hypothetical protein